MTDGHTDRQTSGTTIRPTLCETWRNRRHCVPKARPIVWSAKNRTVKPPIFLRMLPVAVARFFCDGVAILCYVLPVLRMTSCYHAMESTVRNQAQRCLEEDRQSDFIELPCLVEFVRMQHKQLSGEINQLTITSHTHIPWNVALPYCKLVQF